MPAGRVGRRFRCNEAARYGWTPQALCDLPWALAKVELRPRAIAESQLTLTVSHSAVSERAVVFVVDADASMRRSQILLDFAGAWTAIAGALICCLTCTLLVARPAHALDPSKRVTQYLHTSWRIQDASAPTGMFTVAQTSEGFLWFSTNSPTIYRFDGVRFLPSHFPYKGGSGNKVFKVLGSRAGGLWAVGSREIAYIKDGAVVYDVQLDGFSSFQNLSEDPDGSLWVVRAAANIADSALCRVADGKVKCFGKAEGVPISPIDSILADGKGGFWLGGQTSLVHWRDGVSETYPIEALRSNVGQHGVVSLALGADGTLWVGMLAEGPGLGIGRLKDGGVKPFVTPTFDGSKVEVYGMTVDREGNLWVASRGKGLYRIQGDVVDHFGRTDGLSSDAVNSVFEDREGILWAATQNGIDSFRAPLVTTFSSLEGLGKERGGRGSGQQGWLDLGCQRRLARPHRQWQHLIPSHRRWSSGSSSRFFARRPRRQLVGGSG